MKKENNDLKPLNENQKWYYQKIMKLGKNKKVKGISYDELFAVLDRVKFCYFLDCLREEGKIEMKGGKKQKWK